VDRLNTTHVELKVEMAGIEKEREFYFDKLREIEMMLQDLEDNGNGNELTASIFEILYATAEGFQPVDDVDGEEAVTEDLPDTAADDEDLETY
ncbi:MAPRE3, partial [Symbiodinium microadriaticum]